MRYLIIAVALFGIAGASTAVLAAPKHNAARHKKPVAAPEQIQQSDSTAEQSEPEWYRPREWPRSY